MRFGLTGYVVAASGASEGDVEFVDGEAVGFACADLESADVDPAGLLAELVEVLGGVGFSGLFGFGF